MRRQPIPPRDPKILRWSAIAPISALLLVAIALVAVGSGAPTSRAVGTQDTAQPADLQSFKRAINEQVRHALKVAPELGVHVSEVDSGQEIYSYKADDLRVIASNTKLITTSAALDRLGPGYFFETPAYLRGETVEGTLRGDMAVVGGGDPNFSGRHWNGDSFARFRPWARELRRLGIRRISGELILVSGFFDDQLIHPDWPDNQLDRWYEAPVADLSFNDNCVLVEVQGTPSRDGMAKVGLVPPLPIFKLQGEVSLTSQPKQQRVRIGRTTRHPDLDVLHTLTVNGRIHRRTEKVDRWVTVPDPVAYFGSALKSALAEEGIVVEGEVIRARSLGDSAWRPLTISRSDLSSTLEVINKRSQNFYSEAVLKTLGARLCGEGSWSAGVRAAEDFLHELGIDRDSYSMADGSGMSRGNRFSASQLTHLLRQMFFHRFGSELIRTLPYSGEAGLSWEKRLHETPYAGNVLAKTGSLSRVSTLSGYAKGRSGKIYAFSILCNQAPVIWKAKGAQDRIVRAIIDHG